MKNSVMIFLALVLLLTTVGVDGWDDQLGASSRLGRKADAGGAAVSLATEDDDDSNPTFGHYPGNTDPKDQVHHVYINGTNPYAPKGKKSP
ncbi:hypothetical protein V6N13_050861 [Hibiscus sabdariffa]|uniref:Uncharacterized protein n=1 Tax=Hibiscus sabdariffa TaxID=183260 RepID=A0ABR2PIJ9_9ROSI